MMTCKEVLESLSEFVDRDVVQDVQAAMERHIGNCTHCRAEFDTLTMTIKLYRHAASQDLPSGCHDRLIKVLELESMKSKRDPDPSGP